MTVNKGLSSLVNSSPDFSNQALENAVYDIKNVDEDDGYLWIKSQFDLQTAIDNNAVLTESQKNDVRESINSAHPHLNIGGFLTDVIKHTNTILDGSIIPGDPAITGTVDNGQGTFLEILSSVHSLQTLIPSLYGVSAKEKARSVNDHLGSLNNIFLETEDSSEPVFTRLKNTMTYLRDRGRILGGSNNFPISSAQHRYYNTQLITLMTTFVPDSTDFQTTLDNAVSLVTASLDVVNTRMGEEGFSQQVTDLVAIRDEITTQTQLEKSNVSGIRSYLNSVSDYQAYVGLAEDEELRKLMARVSQNTNWITYFTDYVSNQAQLNPIYNAGSDSDKSAIIDQVLRNSGLPDVVDHLDLDAVANKAKRDDRIDTKGFDKLVADDQIISSCRQLAIDVSGKSIYELSQRLLNNMNQNDRDKIQQQLDLNESSNTLS